MQLRRQGMRDRLAQDRRPPVWFRIRPSHVPPLRRLYRQRAVRAWYEADCGPLTRPLDTRDALVRAARDGFQPFLAKTVLPQLL